MKNKTKKIKADWSSSNRSCVEANIRDLDRGVITPLECIDRILAYYESHIKKNFVAKEEVKKIIHSLKDLQITREDDLTSLVNKLLIWREIKLESLK